MSDKPLIGMGSEMFKEKHPDACELHDWSGYHVSRGCPECKAENKANEMIKQRVDLICPVCDSETEFKKSSGFGGVILEEIFSCHKCKRNIERLWSRSGEMKTINIGKSANTSPPPRL